MRIGGANTSWIAGVRTNPVAEEEKMAMSYEAHHEDPWNPRPERVIHHHHQAAPARSSGIAALLEFLPGFFVHVFGVGHIYAGNVGTGVSIMLGYWLLQAINIVLCLFLVGLVTLPLTWLLFVICSPIGAANAAAAARYR